MGPPPSSIRLVISSRSSTVSRQCTFRVPLPPRFSTGGVAPESLICRFTAGHTDRPSRPMYRGSSPSHPETTFRSIQIVPIPSTCPSSCITTGTRAPSRCRESTSARSKRIVPNAVISEPARRTQGPAAPSTPPGPSRLSSDTSTSRSPIALARNAGDLPARHAPSGSVSTTSGSPLRIISAHRRAAVANTCQTAGVNPPRNCNSIPKLFGAPITSNCTRGLSMPGTEASRRFEPNFKVHPLGQLVPSA